MPTTPFYSFIIRLPSTLIIQTKIILTHTKKITQYFTMKTKTYRGGFKLRSKLSRFFQWILPSRSKTRYRRLNPSPESDSRDGFKLSKWGDLIRRRARELCFFKDTNRRRTGYARLGLEEGDRKAVPRGYLAVSVGETEEEVRKVVVPVIYLNHPLFGELLKEAEEVYGFDHPGEIKLPCPLSRFEMVWEGISGGGGGGNCRRQCRSGHHHHRTVKFLQF